MFSFMNKFRVATLLVCMYSPCMYSHWITAGLSVQVGDNIASFSLAKILSLKYNIPLYYHPFLHADLFILDAHESKEVPQKPYRTIRVSREEDITSNLNKKELILFYTDVFTKIDYINSAWLAELKRILQLKEPPTVAALPEDKITVAVHIRKGNGGGQFYDGEQSSLQLFDFDRSWVMYIKNYNNHPFDWPTYTRNVKVDTVDAWQTKFPPDQFYVDQIIKLSNDLHNKALFVQIFTDDKEPQALVNKIKTAVNKPNIFFFYVDNRNLSFKEQIAYDLQSMSRFDVLIRSQSYFSRIAELMGNNKMVISPLSFIWRDKKLIMNKIVVKGSLNELKH
jgi:hypothetical protein